MRYDNKIVNFSAYCVDCKHIHKDETEEPCDSCLSEPVNQNTHTPVKYEEAEKKKGAKE